MRIEVGGQDLLREQAFPAVSVLQTQIALSLVGDKGILRGLVPLVNNWLQHSKGRRTKLKFSPLSPGALLKG